MLTPYLSALDFCHSLVLNYKFDELDFYCLCNLQKSSSNLEKNLVHQTRDFKLENIKNQVQIDKENASLLKFRWLVTMVTDNSKPRPFRILLAFQAFQLSVIRQCHKNSDLLCFFQSLKSQHYISGMMSCGWLKEM